MAKSRKSRRVAEQYDPQRDGHPEENLGNDDTTFHFLDTPRKQRIHDPSSRVVNKIVPRRGSHSRGFDVVFIQINGVRIRLNS